MKIIKVIFIYLCLSGFASKAQITFKIDSNVNGTVYAGILSGVKYLIDSTKVDRFITVRAGAHAKWQIARKFKLSSFAVLEFGTDKPIGLYSFALTYSPTNWLAFTAGHTPPPLPLLLRPYPLNGNSQFETWTQQRVPGAAPSAYFTIGNKGPKVYGGVSLRNQTAEYEVEVVYRAFTVGGYVRDSLWGVAGQVSTKDEKFFQITVFDNTHTLANTSVVNLHKGEYSLYCDIGYNFSKEELPRLEVGALKNFKSKYVSGLFGLSYQVETSSANAYLFFHL